MYNYVYFGKQWCLDDVPPLCINSRNIERVVTFKLLGVAISSDLTSPGMIICCIFCQNVLSLFTAFVLALNHLLTHACMCVCTEVLASYNDEDIYLFDCTRPDDKCSTYLHRYTGHRNNATGRLCVT